MVFFSQGRGGGEEVAYGYKGKGVTNHLLVDHSGNPVGVKSTAANISEQDQVLPLLQKVDKFLRRLIAKGVTPILEADKGYDSRALRIMVLLARIFPCFPPVLSDMILFVLFLFNHSRGVKYCAILNQTITFYLRECTSCGTLAEKEANANGFIPSTYTCHFLS
jgi:hypothetical protein